MKSVVKYLHLWLLLTANSFMVSFTSKFNAFLFLTGKFFRFLFFAVFLLAIFGKTRILGSYTVSQMIFFFLSFNLMDTITQLFYREVYRFRPMVVSGDFDLVLVKPINPLFRALAGGADPLDLLMLIPYIGALGYVGSQIQGWTPWSLALYLLLLINGFFIATGFHIFVLALAVITTEIDHAVMIYRDLTSMGRVPVDIYQEPLRSILTFIIPVGIMMTFPAKAFLGILSPSFVVISLGIGLIFFFIATRAWQYALSQYSSASS